MKKIVCSTLVCMIMSLISCDKIKEATSIDFHVNGVNFQFSAVSNAETSTKSAEEVTLRALPQTFTVTRTVDIAELGDPDVIKYADKINNVEVSNAQIVVTSIPEGDYTIENLTVTAVGVTGSLVVDRSFTTNSAFTLLPTSNAFTKDFILKLRKAKSVPVTVTGKTDAPAGTTIHISYESDLLFTANIF